MPVIHLIRHGSRDHDGSPGDPPLNDAGRGQAARTASVLRDIDAVYASPLARARETAEIIAAAHGLPCTVEPRLRERMNWGDLPGQSWDDFTAAWDRSTADRDFVPLGGDASRAAGRRIEDFIADLAAEGTIVAVTHGGVLVDFLLNVFGRDDVDRIGPGFWDAPYDWTRIANCSITTVRTDPWTIDALGSTEHLGDER